MIRHDFAAPLRVLAALVFTLAASAGAAQTHSTGNYDYYVTGATEARANAQTGETIDVAIDVEVPVPATQAVMLEGGDGDVRAAFQWMVARAGGGAPINFLVLRTSGSDGYNKWIYNQVGGVASVESIVTRSRDGASDRFVLERIAKADAIFIASGDQAVHIQQWQGTPLAKAVNAAIRERNVPVGGTSAGLMVLSQFVFSAQFGSITSAEALADYNAQAVSLVRDVFAVPALAGMVVDSHLVKRDRMGRLVTFMGRTVLDGWTSLAAARAIGVEAKAALLIEGSQVRLAGPGAAYFLNASNVAPQACSTTNPALTFPNIQVQRMEAKDQAFDLAGWTPAMGSAPMVSYDVSALCGEMFSSQGGNKLY